jgi:P4 family phage/plasmid primase-like protien
MTSGKENDGPLDESRRSKQPATDESNIGREPITCNANAQYSFTVITSRSNIGKRIDLGDHGLKKQGVRMPGDSTATRRSAASLRDFDRQVQGLGATNAVVHGVTAANVCQITTLKNLEKAAPGTMARGKDYFDWPVGAGLLLVDHDPVAPNPSADDLDRRIGRVIPAWLDCTRLYRSSASSHVNDADLDFSLVDVAGIHAYIGVANAADIPTIGKRIFDRLILAGEGYVRYSKSGQPLVRTLVDNKVWQPERVDFLRADLGRGLTQVIPAGRVFEAVAHESLVSGDRLITLDKVPALTDVEAAAVEAIRHKLVSTPDVLAESARLQAAHALLRLRDSLPKGASESEIADFAADIAKRLHSSQLFGGLVITLDDGQKVTVDEICADPDKYHDQRCHDPIDDEGDPRVAMILTKRTNGSAGPAIHTHLHGGRMYDLVSSVGFDDGAFAEKRVLVDHLKAMIGATDAAGLNETAALIKAELPDDSLVRSEVIGAFRKRFNFLTGTPLSLTDARALLIGSREATVLNKRPRTEFGNAERMLDRYADSLMYVAEIGAWYLWTGVYWRKAVNVEIEFLAQSTVRAMIGEVEAIDDTGERAAYLEWCATSQQAKMVSNMLKIAAADARVFVPAAELDKHSHLLGVQNGVIDLRTGRLEPAEKRHRITLVAGCDGVVNAQAPLFEKTVRDVFSGDLELVDYFYRVLGYALMGDPTEDVMFIPFGNGSNGKSTVFGVVRQAFGTYAKVADASTFISDGKSGNAGGAREDLVRLRGARFLYVNEPDENGELREGSVKSMTGGDAITARGVYATASVEIKPTWAVFMPTNHKPIVKGSDNGIWRRLVLMPFDRNFDDDPTVVKDPDREKTLLAEMEGVLMLCVRAAMAYQTDGLAQPAAVKAARDSYRTQMDLLGEWLEDCCEIGSGLQAESNRLWLSWEQFAKDRGILNYVKSSIALGRRLEQRFPSGKSSGVRMRTGLRLKSEHWPFDVLDELDG